MASKFKIWVDEDHLDNVQSYSAFEGDNQRKAGFLPGTPASSLRVNTALRQANLIACALMEIADPDGTVDFRNNVNDVKDLITNYLTNNFGSKAKVDENYNSIFKILSGEYKVAKALDVTTTINGKQISSIFETNGTTVKRATDVTTNINGKPISNIFESNGTTVKLASNAINANNTTTVQNVDLSDNTKSQFGTNILLKKVVLWSGTKYLKANGDTTFNLTQSCSDGDLIEIEYMANINNLGDNFLFFTQGRISSSTQPLMLNFNTGKGFKQSSDSSTIINDSLIPYLIIDGNVMTHKKGRFFGISSNQYTIDIGTDVRIAGEMRITRITKIIDR